MIVHVPIQKLSHPLISLTFSAEADSACRKCGETHQSELIPNICIFCITLCTFENPGRDELIGPDC